MGHAVKPAPGMIRNAMRDLGFDPGEAVVIGDSDADMGPAPSGVLRVAPAGGPTATGAAGDFLEANRRASALFA